MAQRYDEELGEWYDDGTPEQLSPWEQAHGGHAYDPDSPDSAPNDFDRATAEYYGTGGGSPVDQQPETNWYDKDSYDYLINQPETPAAGGSGQRPPQGPPRPGTPRVPGLLEYPIAGGKRFFEYPDWVPPNIAFGKFAPPSFDVAPFDYPEFAGPTRETFQTDPGYEFRAEEMDRGVKNLRSSQGLLSTGGTLADLMKMRGGLASQEFGNVWNRQHQGWQSNRDLAMDKWRSNYQTESDEFGRALTSYLTEDQANENEWMRSRDLYTTNLGKEAASYGLNLDTSRLNLARDSSQFGNLLSLYQMMTRNLPTYSPTV